MTNRETVGVIGAGLGGLTAACTLAARGHRVVVLEKNSWLGGKAAQLEGKGYRFDMGPTILTLPSVLKRVYEEAGEVMSDHLNLIRLDPQWRSFFEDGSILDLVADPKQMSARLEAFSEKPGGGVAYQKFIDWSERLHRISEKYFFWKPVGGMLDMIDLKGSFEPGVLKDVLRMRMGSTVAKSVRSHISDARVSQMIDHFTQYVGSNPSDSPAVLCGIAHMQTDEGVWYPQGGTRAVPVALTQLAERLGVEFRTDTQVAKILHDKGRVTGLQTQSGERIALGAVVSNSDTVRGNDELLDGVVQKRFTKRRSYEAACSGVVLYLGLKKRYDHVLHHNFVFSRDPHEEFEAIYKRGEPAPDPTCYVCAPSATEPGVAPEGGEALYVLVHAPYLRPGHDWNKMFPAYRRTIIEKLKRTSGMEDIEERIEFEGRLTPTDIDQRYHVLKGAIYGLASHGRFFGAFKPSNRSPDLRGLYFAGGSAHPGPGMPMVMMSGWIAADALDQDAGKESNNKSSMLESGKVISLPKVVRATLPEKAAALQAGPVVN